MAELLRAIIAGGNVGKEASNSILSHSSIFSTTPFSPCKFVLLTLSVLLFTHAQRPLFVCLHSWASTLTMVVGFLLAHRFVVYSFLTWRPLFVFFLTLRGGSLALPHAQAEDLLDLTRPGGELLTCGHSCFPQSGIG